jgi:SAM-dependent methyltransferase
LPAHWGGFSPAAIAYARDLALRAGVADRCTWLEQDVRTLQLAPESYAAALFLYGQLAVFPKEEAVQLLKSIANALQPGARLCIELLDQERVDKTNSTWWYTDNSGLWGDAPFLHLGERFWDAEQQIANERFQIIHLETGALTEVHLSDQSYAVATMTSMLQEAGFAQVQVYPAWAGLPLYDAQEWVIYVAEK